MLSHIQLIQLPLYSSYSVTREYKEFLTLYTFLSTTYTKEGVIIPPVKVVEAGRIIGRGLVLFVSIGGWFETATSFKTVFLESSILTPVPLWRVSALDFLVTGISLLRRYQVRNILEDGPKFWPSRDSDFCKKSDAYPDGSHMLQDPRHHRNM